MTLHALDFLPQTKNSKWTLEVVNMLDIVQVYDAFVPPDKYLLEL